MANTSAAIVALPAPLDTVRLIGDEEKHATLLFFGETNTLPEEAKSTLVDSVKLAATMLFPFREGVRDITRLGTENPPALVAMLSDRCIGSVRNLFMMNPAVKSYMDNSPQFPGFTPHVTLGHPDFTDEVIIRQLAKQLFGISFDRLAVWWNEERIEIPLSLMVEGDSMAMSEAVDIFLEHHGVVEHAGTKGMKWGVRKDGVKGATTGRTKIGNDLAKSMLVDHAYAKRGAQIAGLSVAGLGAAALAPGLLPASAVVAAGGATVLSGKIALAATVATRAAFVHNYISYANRAAARVAHAVEMPNHTVEQVYNSLDGKKKVAADLLIADTAQGVEFSDDPEIQDGWLEMTPAERAVVLFIASGSEASSQMSHSDLLAVIMAEPDDAQQHGVKGQKWGVRRTIDAATGLVKKAPKPSEQTGLVPRTSSADQIAKDRIAKKLNEHGTESLSNKDIQDYTRRLQLEADLVRQVKTLNAQDQAKADGFIKRFVKNQTSRQFDRVANKAIDVAVEKVLHETGMKIGKKGGNPDAADLLVKTASRLGPKKGK